jgi:Glycosyl transferase family 2
MGIWAPSLQKLPEREPGMITDNHAFLGKKIPRKLFPNVNPESLPSEKSHPSKASRLFPGVASGAGRERRPFVFVIPVRNPGDDKVRDYATVEALLDKTLRSVLQQTHGNIRVVVVCHGKPKNAVTRDSRVVYLDVSRTGVFRPNCNVVQIDKGLRYVIGVAFAMREFQPELVMLMDADDYVNTGLADLAISEWPRQRDIDGFLIESGLHVQLKVGPRHDIAYENAIIVGGFNFTCGSCRIFSAARLRQRLEGISPDILDRLAGCKPARNGSFRISATQARWLYGITLQKPAEPGLAHELVHALGRHIRQEGIFRFFPLPILGAAKGCGHGNHDGPRAGALREDWAIGDLSIPAFERMFGLDV